MRALSIALAALTTGCLQAPAPPPLDDAGTPPDAGAPPRLALESVEIEDLSGAAWPDSAMPRRPVIRLTWTTAPRLDPDTEPPVWILRGAPDDALLDDLSSAPLRVANTSRIVPATLVAGARTWELRIDERLDRGADATLAIGAWLRDADGEPVEGATALGLRVGEDPSVGAEVRATWPPDGAMAVSPSLTEIAIALDGPFASIAEGSILLLEGDRPEDTTAAAVPCPDVGWPDGWCVRLTPSRPLRRGSEHRIAIDTHLLDATGAPIGPWEGRFTTSSDDAPPPPELRVPERCALDETLTELGCLLADDERIELRIDAGEPVRWRWALGDAEVFGIAPRGAVTIHVGGLAPETALEGQLTLEGTSGAVTALSLPVETTEPLATVAIVEVRPDPRGPEPTQEYVEILNFGAMPLALDGFSLSDRDDAIGDLLSGTLAPSERVLVVPERFDAEDPADPPVPPGVRLVRVDGPLGSGGIANAGEPLFLRDPAGHRVSSAPARAAAPGICLVREGPSMRDAEGFALAPCTPGVP
ncbi:MAG: hypothetical protein H6719_03815 [Sandaracinaceae bacterium]|nr:hypothetical protein [Sandaracinaceae bacterium]